MPVISLCHFCPPIKSTRMIRRDIMSGRFLARTFNRQLFQKTFESMYVTNDARGGQVHSSLYTWQNRVRFVGHDKHEQKTTMGPKQWHQTTYEDWVRDALIVGLIDTRSRLSACRASVSRTDRVQYLVAAWRNKNHSFRSARIYDICSFLSFLFSTSNWWDLRSSPSQN